MRLVASALFLIAAPLAAQVQPRPVGADPRIQVAEYHPDRVIRIEAAEGYQVTLQFASDERIENVAVGDAAAWQVSANKRGDLLFVKPVRSGVGTNLTVATDARIYAFELAPLAAGFADAAFLVRFDYPQSVDQPALDALPRDAIRADYRLSGARALRPVRISDDGLRTYITWSQDDPLPAVYTVDAQGVEALANGHMQGGVYVVDGVLPRLIFRIDRQTAQALRRPRSAAP